MKCDPRFGVKQFIGVVTNRRGTPFMVFTTGDAKWLLFSQCYPGTLIQTCLQFPVEKKRLIDPVRRALSNGCGIDTRDLPQEASGGGGG